MDRPIISGGIRIARITEQDVPSLLLQRVARIRPVAGFDLEYTLLILGGKEFTDYLAPIFTGISVPHVSPEQITAFRIALPSAAEQRAIVRLVSEHTSPFEVAIAAANREIQFLNEFRIGLIADVVTGKLDVRTAAAGLPETLDLAPIDERTEGEDLDEAIDLVTEDEAA